MELTEYASWLNEVFGLFDTFFLGLHHELAISYGDIVTPIANFLGAAGHWGVMFIALAVLLLFFRKTRMAGVAMIFALAIAGGLSEFVIKDIVARPRPFMMSDTFEAWWQFVGSPAAHGTSFPSGHVAGATAAMIALAYGARRWWVSLGGVLVIVAMAMDRMYLVVHYPSDVLAGFILGFFAGIVGYAIIQGVWRLFGKHPDQLAAAKAAASMHAREVDIPRGAAPQQYDASRRTLGSQGRMPASSAAPAVTPGAAAENVLATPSGQTVAIPQISPEAQAAGETRAIDPQAGGTAQMPRSNADSGFQMAEEYWRE